MRNFPPRRIPLWEQRTSLTGPAARLQREADENAEYADTMVELLDLEEPDAVKRAEDADVER